MHRPLPHAAHGLRSGDHAVVQVRVNHYQAMGGGQHAGDGTVGDWMVGHGYESA